jgi:hypothetical protein
MDTGLEKEENGTKTYLVSVMDSLDSATSRSRENIMTVISAPSSFQLESAINKER